MVTERDGSTRWHRVAVVGALGALVGALLSPAAFAVRAQGALPAGTGAAADTGSVVPVGAVYVPHRVARGKSFTDFEAMLQELSEADVVYLGEQHNDRGTHVLQLAVLEGLARRDVPVVLSLEMFERDAQAALDAYLAGTMPESAFLRGVAAVAQLRPGLSPARGVREGARLAGDRGERAACAGLGGVTRRPRRPRHGAR